MAHSIYNRHEITLTIVITFGTSFAFGVNIGCLNLINVFIADMYREMNEYRSGLINSTVDTDSYEYKAIIQTVSSLLFVPGVVIGAFIGGHVVDKLGRLKTIIFSQIFTIIGVILMTSSKAALSIEMLIIGRIFAGISDGVGFTVTPLLISEVASTRARGALLTLHQLFITLGILVGNVVGFRALLGTQDRWNFIFLTILPSTLVIVTLVPTYPETPGYLIKVKRNEELEYSYIYSASHEIGLIIKNESYTMHKFITNSQNVSAAEMKLKRLILGSGRKSLEYYRGSVDVDSEFDEILRQREIEDEEKKKAKFTFIRLFTDRGLRKPALLVCFLVIAQQLSGINVIMCYSVTVFTAAGVPQHAIQYTVAGTSVVNVIATVVAIPIMDKAGRRILLLGPMALMVVVFIVITIALNFKDYSFMAYIAIAAVEVYVVLFAIGIGPICITIASEIFRQEARPKAMMLSSTVLVFFTFVVGFTFEHIMKACKEFTFIIFVALMAFFFAVSYKFVPETKNRTIEDIADEMTGSRKRKNEEKKDFLISEPDVKSTTGV